MEGQRVLLRGRVHTTRSKGKSAFLVLRQGTATVQLVLFVDEEKVSKQMVKYAAGIPRESIVEVGGDVVRPQAAIESCTQARDMRDGGAVSGGVLVGRDAVLGNSS